ncbi:plant UBX domain-containing protein 10-like isoform X2 [Salvia miltiorrhiza]|uniref:plant UBX domain-containing protein 10-like isoform X2 n=1 Tax=Salvia miltiorrhiza TaxID=226208 RepID=UPI0025AC4D78|nr:plant UBX domain-containing protein 10-like isoform X2 [Salvia miltiorrhiza]
MSSSSMREMEAACNGLVRRMVSLPRNILGGFSRAMNQGIDRMWIGGGRRNHPNLPPPPPLLQEEWAFLSTFEQQHGPTHPFFYACRLMDALKIAKDEHKLMFMYIHSPDHPFTPNFCRETLCSELVVQFVDANFVSWGGISSRGEGLHMATTLKVSSFPFCAIVAPAPGDNLAVLQQMEGPVSPAELVEILQGTLEEQGLAFGSGARPNLEEKRRADRRLKEEQDAAYLAALTMDQRERERPSAQDRLPKSVIKQPNKASETSSGKKGEVTQILIRFPNGERREHSFLSTDKIEAIYRYIDSLGLAAAGNYRLISNFPRKVYGVDEMSMTLKDAALKPKASLFLEML